MFYFKRQQPVNYILHSHLLFKIIFLNILTIFLPILTGLVQISDSKTNQDHSWYVSPSFKNCVLCLLPQTLTSLSVQLV